VKSDWRAGGPFRFAVGIEDTFVPQQAPGQRKLDEYELTQHYEHWEEDLQLVADAGADTLRWGIPWYLVQPEPDRFAWEWVDRVVDRMAEMGLRCVVDLMHYGTPLWLSGEFLSADYPERVAAYAAAAAERYGDRLSDWTPLNEPAVNAAYCGERGLWPPNLTGEHGFVRVLLQLAEGICRTQAAITDVQADAAFVHVDAGSRFEGDPHALPLEVVEQRPYLALDLVTGKVDEEHPLFPWLTANGAEERRLEWFRRHTVTPNVIGVNYYPAFTTFRYGEHGTPVPVEAGTHGLDELMRSYFQRYGLPVMVTETSRGGPILDRRLWLAESVQTVEDLRRDGIPVVGYTWFPFMTLVDWRYREAETPVDDWLVHMGLVDLVHEPGGDLARHRTAALDDFRAASRRGMPAVGPARPAVSGRSAGSR
jgi:beta-glucosidase/6-phospho-beta-glucosidase/beta-galactosidase